MAAPKDHALSGYCVWLVPPAALERRLAGGIVDLSHAASQLTGTPSPPFAPHVTLFSPKSACRNDLDAMRQATRAALDAYARTPGGGGPVRVVLNNPSAGDRYYQCVLAPVDEAAGRGAALESIREAFCAAFAEDQPFFFPHLSLCYGDLSEGQRWRVAEAAVKCADWPLDEHFPEVVIVDVNGTAEEWKVVERYQL